MGRRRSPFKDSPETTTKAAHGHPPGGGLGAHRVASAQGPWSPAELSKKQLNFGVHFDFQLRFQSKVTVKTLQQRKHAT